MRNPTDTTSLHERQRSVFAKARSVPLPQPHSCAPVLPEDARNGGWELEPLPVIEVERSAVPVTVEAGPIDRILVAAPSGVRVSTALVSRDGVQRQVLRVQSVGTHPRTSSDHGDARAAVRVPPVRIAVPQLSQVALKHITGDIHVEGVAVVEGSVRDRQTITISNALQAVVEAKDEALVLLRRNDVSLVRAPRIERTISDAGDLFERHTVVVVVDEHGYALTGGGAGAGAQLESRLWCEYEHTFYELECTAEGSFEKHPVDLERVADYWQTLAGVHPQQIDFDLGTTVGR